MEKFVGYLWVGLRNLFWNNFGAVWDLILCIKTRLFKILSWNIFKILLCRNSSLRCANLSLQCMIRMACFCILLIFLRFVLLVLPQAIFVSRLFLIRSNHVCVTLAEYSESCSNFFYWAYFCFLHDIILKEDGNNIKCKQISLSFQTISIYWKKIFWKQTFPSNLPQITFQIASCTKISNIFYKIKYNGQSCQTVHRCLWKSYSDEFYRKTPMQESLFQ